MQTKINNIPKLFSYSGVLLVLIIILQISCKKLIEVDAPFTSLNAANVYTSDATAAAVLTGIYTQMSADNSNGLAGGFTSMSLFPSLSGDELTLYDPTNLKYSGYYKNMLTSSSNVGTVDYWSIIYPIIFITNSAIEGLGNSASLTSAVKQKLLGEAKFMRAFCYFYLVNLYGDVPLAMSTDWKVNAALIRTPQAQVYQQIIADLKEAQNLLSINYLKSDAITPYPTISIERVRPTKWAATALLARVYLYTGDYINAEVQAAAVINNSSLYSLNSLKDVFKKNSAEAIWQLQAVGAGTSANTGEGKTFILPATGPAFNYPVYLSNNMVNSFEPGDKRKVNWVGSVTPTPPGTTTYYYPFKYKIGAVNTTPQEYCMILRLAEQYLIRAEARAQQNNISGAQSDLNMTRTRAVLGNTTANDKTSLLLAIMQERKVELFTEWGHRWLDLKRTNSVDPVMSLVTPTKGGTWVTTAQLYPIPLSELQKAPQLVQNQGY